MMAFGKRRHEQHDEHANCEKHPFEVAEGRCRTCRRAFCSECLVYAFGPKKAPLCISCAIEAAGIRRARAGTQLSVG